MRIILTKATEIRGKKLPIGSRMEVSAEFFDTIKDSAQEYHGEMRPKKKPKTDLFKPKI